MTLGRGSLVNMSGTGVGVPVTSLQGEQRRICAEVNLRVINDGSWLGQCEGMKKGLLLYWNERSIVMSIRGE